MHRSAFSLVELSIVLVILGLLTGGILAGKSLIRASELRSTISDVARFRVAITAFRDKYFSLPGDMANAEAFWGTDTATACSSTPVAGDRTPKIVTCNGNGNNIVLGNTTESFRTWQHLANAGLIEGQYSGVTGSVTAGDHDPGINCPKLRIGNSSGSTIFTLGSLPAGSGSSYIFEGSYGTVMELGACGTWDCILPLFTPGDAWNIDTKLDDGKPGTGVLVTRVSCAAGGCLPNCNTAATNASGEAAAATYSLDKSDVACSFYYKNL